MFYQFNGVCAEPQGLQGGGKGIREVECIIWGGREQGLVLIPSIPNLDPLPFEISTQSGPGFLDFQLMQELGKCKSLHG